ncbi:MAG: hypothetical protein U5N53_32870 [Mycobacterium sp.]|nr:hypothetical protein [Mycobacterium sp.]
MTDPRDETWMMVEEAVFRLFAEVVAEHGQVHVPLGDRLDELGWSEIENEYPISAWQLLFRAQARSLANTDCLDRVMLAGLRTGNEESATAVVLPRAVLADPACSADGDGRRDSLHRHRRRNASGPARGGRTATRWCGRSRVDGRAPGAV